MLADKLEKLKLTVQEYKIELIIVSFGLILILTGSVFLLFNSKNNPDSEVKIIQLDEAENNSNIFVDIGGAVKVPGVYKLKAGDRIAQAIEVAGGLRTDADGNWVSKNLNLAAKLSDGMKIYVPFAGETFSPPADVGVSSGVAAVNINTASQKELESLPAIGPVTAAKIINNRPYFSVDDLVKRKVVSQSTYDKIKDKITIF